MPRADETRVVPFTAGQMYDLVADVRRYPEFIPWCAALRVRSEEIGADGRGELVADMVARFKGFEEKFRTRVTLDQAAHVIDVAYLDGPFSHLKNVWRFEPLGERASRVHFHIDFEFRSRLLKLVASAMFERALTKLSDAFEARAGVLYGDRPPHPSSRDTRAALATRDEGSG
jgi:coenzyme Q-binding protein COQ10